MERVDIAVIGTGPAGISAAINAKIRGKSFTLFGSERLSAKVGCSERIENYPGITGVTGAELNGYFRSQLDSLDIPITKEQITGIYNMGKYFLIMADQTEYEASSVIIATGVEAVKAVPGERELLGRGVSYCATCDGRLYKGKNIAVVCDNADMEDEVDYLCGLAGTVYYFPLFKTDFARENLQRQEARIAKIEGAEHVEGVTLKDGARLDLDGVFFLKQSVSADVLLRGLKMEDGQILVDRNMATSIKGCFAAGDCTGRPYQITKAVGEGNIAAHSAIAYLAEQNKEKKGER
ncbi:MAG: NAD(P)/FAD-dependent oxidoreductase [Butyrivibrio sp.]|nr:NAD(P)/FAD-dependent oxidoreductase [Butyrivibrio sp.]